MDLGIEPVAIVTPRARDAARGISTDEFVETEGLDDEERDALPAEIAPSLALNEAD